jgi:hypothetical protein
MLTPILAHARLVASSPSGWAMPWSPAGDTHRGNAMSRLNRLVLVLTFETSFRTRGRMRYLMYAVEFSRTVTWFVAPELKKSVDCVTLHRILARLNPREGFIYREWKLEVTLKLLLQDLLCTGFSQSPSRSVISENMNSSSKQSRTISQRTPTLERG